MERHPQGRGRQVERVAKKWGADKVGWLGGYLLAGSLVLNHCGWHRTVNQTGSSDHARRVKAAFVARSRGREASAVCHLPAQRDGWLQRPGTLLVPSPCLWASAATSCSLRAQVPYRNGLRHSRTKDSGRDSTRMEKNMGIWVGWEAERDVCSKRRYLSKQRIIQKSNTVTKQWFAVLCF